MRSQKSIKKESAPTHAQLLAFIKRRNASSFASNLQFQIDARESGFDAADLGVPEVIEGDGKVYVWRTPHGQLEERSGVLRLVPAAAP